MSTEFCAQHEYLHLFGAISTQSSTPNTTAIHISASAHMNSIGNLQCSKHLCLVKGCPDRHLWSLHCSLHFAKIGTRGCIHMITVYVHSCVHVICSKENPEIPARTKSRHAYCYCFRRWSTITMIIHADWCCDTYFFEECRWRPWDPWSLLSSPCKQAESEMIWRINLGLKNNRLSQSTCLPASCSVL
jgi:hypothetical protein